MSKGTKQIRLGRVERLKAELEAVKKVMEQRKDSPVDTPEMKAYRHGYADALEIVIASLEELGK